MGREVLETANMFKIVLVAALVVEAKFLSQASQPNGRIVGDNNANIEDYPYHVSFQRYNQHACGGSIISPARYIILTAAHCTNPFPDARIMSIRYGTSLMHQGGSVLNVAEVLQHPSYNPDTNDYDISLLKLVGNVQMSPQAERVNLVPLYLQEGSRSANVTGWGRIDGGGPISRRLQVVEVREVDRDECGNVYGHQITERMICFIDDDQDACRYDSGGPLVDHTGQIGVVSWGSGCEDATRPGVYTNIGNKDIREYIESNAKRHCTK